MKASILNIVEKINTGSKWNGQFYTDKKGLITIYVDNVAHAVGEVKWDGEERKQYILDNVSAPKKAESCQSYGDVYEKYGFDVAEEGVFE